jgi:hypothetical protein
MYDTEGPYQVFLWYRLEKYQENTNRYHTKIPNRDTALINTLDPPKKFIRKLGGLLPINSTLWHGAPGLMWSARGPFPPAAAMVVKVVTPVVFCAKATEKRNKNTKISCLLPKS